MSLTKTEKAIPTPSPTVFETSMEYTQGTLNVFINGKLRVADNDDGFIELGDRKFQLKETPHPHDDIQAMYQTTMSVIQKSIDECITFPIRVRLGGNKFKASIKCVV